MCLSSEQIIEAIDGNISKEQAEKLTIIRAHMDCIEVCKLNLDSVILGIAEKYLPQLNIISTVSGIKSFSSISIITEIGVICPCFQHRNIYALGQV